MINFGVILNHMTDIAKTGPRSNQFNSFVHALLCDFAQSSGVRSDFPDIKHFARVAVVAVMNNGNVDVYDVAVFEGQRAGDPVTDDLVDGGADRARESLVVEGGGDGSVIEDVLVAELVEFVGGHARDDVRRDEVEHTRGQRTGSAHLLDLFGCFNFDVHGSGGAGDGLGRGGRGGRRC